MNDSSTVAPDASSVHRALVIKLRHHGDVLLSSPVAQVLSNRFPAAEIDALVYSETQDMISTHPAISRVHVIDRRWKRQGLGRQLRYETRLLKALRERKYDLLVHLTTHWRGWWLAAILRPRWSVAPRRVACGWQLPFSHVYAVQWRTPRHSVEENLDALRAMGIHPTEHETGLVMRPAEDDRQRVAGLLYENGLPPSSKFVQLHPTSRWMFKAWTERGYAELIEELLSMGVAVVLTASPDPMEIAMVARIRDRVRLRGSLVDLSGKLSLKELAALTSGARLFIGVDSAPMHIAAAVGTPVVAVFGPSDERVWGPWKVPSTVIALTEQYPCRPCGLDGCGGGKVSECLTSIDVQRMALAVREALTAPCET